MDELQYAREQRDLYSDLANPYDEEYAYFCRKLTYWENEVKRLEGQVANKEV